MRLTDIAIRALAVPEKGQRLYYDDTLPSFGCRISQGGTRSFFVQVGVERQFVTVGRYPVISLAEARAEAKRVLAEHTLGRTRPKTVRFDTALAEYFTDLEQRIEQGQNKARTLKDYKRLISRHFKFGRRQLIEITHEDITRKLPKAPAERNHALVAIKIFLSWAQKPPRRAPETLRFIEEVERVSGVPVNLTDAAPLTVPLACLLHDPGDVVERITGTICKQELAEAGLFTVLQERLYSNVCLASGVSPEDEKPRKPLITAAESELGPIELVETYLKGTPFVDLFLCPVPFTIPEKTRFEHHWIIGGTGHGKTNAIGNLLIDDLQRVADGEASIVVIDSQNSLIPMLAHLPFFAEGGLLDGKLVLIDASDVEYPLALNLFDVGLQRLDRYSLLDRERLLNTAAEVMEFILQSLLGAEMTSRQSTLFGYALQAMQLIPNATIHTFRELMEPNGRKKFAAHLASLQGRARDFFETQFDADIFRQTKQQVVARLFAICENRTFDRMLSHPKSKLDLFTEINSGKVILINTAKDLLKQQGTEIFGRFFLALIAQAAQERATLPLSKRLPCFVYIDECQDYLSTDSNFTMILEQARKQNVGIIAAHQYVTQLSPKTLDSLYANTSIKFAGGVSDKDAYALARNMRCEPSFIAEQPRGSFAAFIRNTTKSAINLKFPLMPHLKEMTREQYDAVLTANRAKYAVHYLQTTNAPTISASDASSISQPGPRTRTEPSNDDWRS